MDETVNSTTAPNKQKLPITLASNRRLTLIVLGVLILVVVIILVVSSLPKKTKPLLSVEYMRSHCLVTATANVFVRGGDKTVTDHISIQGKKSDVTSKKPFLKYTWQLDKSDQFCGIAGEFPQPNGPSKVVSLRPTVQSAHSGEYTTDLNNKTSLPMAEFFVYAKSTK